MPIIKSAKKRVRVSQAKSQINTLHRSGVKTAVRSANRAIEAATVEAEVLVRRAASRLDRAASKGAIHRNKAARLKSRLSAKLKQSGVASEAKVSKKTADTAKPAAKKAAAKKTTTKKTAAKKAD